MTLRKFVAIACFAACCGMMMAEEATESVDARTLARSWLSIKELIQGSSDHVPEGVQYQLERFSKQISLYEASSVFHLAEIHSPGLESNTRELKRDVNLLSIFLHDNHESNENLAAIDGIDSRVMRILMLDNQFISSINRTYINVMYLFLAICLFAIFLIVMNRRSILNAERSEAYATAYARSVVQAHEVERKKLARELHDTIVQDVTGMKIKTETLYYAITKDSAQYDSSFDSLIANEQSCIENIRTVCYELRPPELDYLDLTAAVSELCSYFSIHSGISCSFTSSGDFNLSGDEETNIFRIIQEALSNAGKHSEATSVCVSLSCDDGKNLLVSVRDNGVGFDTEVLNLAKGLLPRNFGLKGIRERADILDGTIEIDSTPGAGTTLSVTIPLTVS